MTRNAYKTDFLYTVNFSNRLWEYAEWRKLRLEGFTVTRWVYSEGYIVVCFWFISWAISPTFEYKRDLEKWLTTAVLDKDEGLLLLILLVALFLGTGNETMDSFWISENEILGSRLEPSLACSRLSYSGEDAKVKGMRKVGGAGKRKKEGISALPLFSFHPCFFFLFFMFALSQFSGPDSLGAWNRLAQALSNKIF